MKKKMKKKAKTLKKVSAKTKIIAKNKQQRKISVKASTKKSKKDSAKTMTKPALKPVSPDLAHSPGHKKLKIDKFADPFEQKAQRQQSTINNISNADIIRKHNSRHRRIISGAAIGKTGRIIIKD